MANKSPIKNGRKSIKSWLATLNYTEVDADGNALGWKQLKRVDQDGVETIYFENIECAIEALEDLQIPAAIKFNIFLKLDDEDKLMIPENKARINYAFEFLDDDKEEYGDDEGEKVELKKIVVDDDDDENEEENIPSLEIG